MSAIDGGTVPSDVPDDLSRLPSLEEDRVRAALEKRFMDNKIYTNINALLGTRVLLLLSTLSAGLPKSAPVAQAAPAVSVASAPSPLSLSLSLACRATSPDHSRASAH